jgi:hypothetical protein
MSRHGLQAQSIRLGTVPLTELGLAAIALAKSSLQGLQHHRKEWISDPWFGRPRTSAN